MRAYRRFIAIEDDKLTGIMNRRKWPSLLGPQAFIDWVKTTYRDAKGQDETPQIKELYVDLDRIIISVCDYYGVNRDDLFTSKRGSFNEPRSAAIYLMRKLRRDRLCEIGQVFKIRKYSTVSSIVERFKLRMKNEAKLRNRVKRVEKYRH